MLPVLGLEIHVLVGAGSLLRRLQQWVVTVGEHHLLRNGLLVLLAARR